MIFLLGGPPRVGKSIIASKIRQKPAVSVVSTDSLCAVLQNVLSPESAPDLFIFDRFNKIPMADRVKLITKDPTVLTRLGIISVVPENLMSLAAVLRGP